MTLTPSERAALGVLSLWPPLNVAALLYFGQAAPAGLPASSAAVLVPAQVLALGVWGALLVVFLAHAARNPRLSAGARWGWAIGLPALGPVALPLYWVRHVSRGV